MALSSTGDTLLLGVVLGLAAGDLLGGAAAVFAGASVLGRWGSSSLAALAGGQAVVGPAGWTGSSALVVSSWLAGAALLLAAPPAPLPVVAFGLAAAAVVAGPGAGGAVAARVVGSIVAVALAWTSSRLLPRRPAARVAAVAGAVACGLAFVA